MARDALKALGLVALAILIGGALASHPRCGRGCQTLAEHLISHGLREFIEGLGG